MSERETQLFELLRDRSFKRGTFRLTSGEMSEYYIDGKMSATHSKAAFLIGEVLYERTKDLRIDGIGGLEVGAVPLVTAAAISYHLHGHEMEGFWVRDKAKAHGTKKRVEGGNLKEGSRVVIVDDVFTKGGSALKAIEAVEEIGCKVVAVIALVDRLQGARELFEKHGVENFLPIFTIRDFGIEIPTSAG